MNLAMKSSVALSVPHSWRSFRPTSALRLSNLKIVVLRSANKHDRFAMPRRDKWMTPFKNDLRALTWSSNSYIAIDLPEPFGPRTHISLFLDKKAAWIELKWSVVRVNTDGTLSSILLALSRIWSATH